MAGLTVVADSKAKEEEAKQSKEKRSRHSLRTTVLSKPARQDFVEGESGECLIVVDVLLYSVCPRLR
jgi:hypothetical protein